MTAEQVVKHYLDAYTSGDVDAAAALVTEDFAFQGPMQATVGREALRQMVAHVAPSARGCRVLRQWGDGNEVSSLYEFSVETGAGPSSVLVSEWNTVRGGQVASSLMVFDSGAFRTAPREDAGQIDPVCGMTVEPATAATHRDYRDRTYYFCREACAERFDKEPDRYLEPAGRA